MEDESACSACHASLIQFLRYHTHEFSGGPKTYTIFAGKDIKQEDIEKAENPCLVGNCTAKFRDLAPFCKGCPPIPSEITKTLKGESGLEITYLGHSCFTIHSKEYTLLLDPFLSGNPNAAISAEEVEASHILVSHAHGDHIGDTDAIAQRCNSVVFCTPEVGTLLSETIKMEQGQPGGNIRTDFGNIKFVTAAHGSGVPGGVACGFVITIEEKKIYFAGDTQLIKDMELLQDEKIDIAMLPIGDRFTMGPDDAIKAAKMINPTMVIPMHYNTMPAIIQDPVQFKEKLKHTTGIEATILSVGEKLSL